MQFVVPQFIDIEPKIFGPITPRQFIIMIVGAGLIFCAYKALNFTLFVFVGTLILALTGILAFFRVNGQPVHFFFLNFIQTNRRPPLRVWKKEILKEKIQEVEEKKEEKIIVPRKTFSTRRLSEISLIVDTGGAYQEE